MKYLTNSGLSYFLNKIKAYLTSSTYLNSIGISNSEIDNIADNEGYSSGSLPASEDVFLTGDIIPNTDNSIDLGASSKNIKMIYTKGITINGTQFLPSDYIPLSGTNALSGNIVPSTNFSYNLGSANYRFREGYFGNLWVGGLFGGLENGIDINYQVGANLILRGKNRPSEAGIFWLVADNGSNSTRMMGSPDGTLTWGSKNVAMAEDVIPRSGGAVISGDSIGRIDDTNLLYLLSGTSGSDGGHIALFGASYAWGQGAVRLNPASSATNYKQMYLFPNGTWTWNGTACQVTSDQRFKQQISNIDDKLLDAWEDVAPVQFKYNDAVDEKGDNARLHTGYVVQQINEACQKHNIDISEYGLYCHEEYPERTEEVTIENEDGTTSKETRVIEPAKEHYSLRYTETLVVECAYLRKRIKELEERLEKLELQ